MASFDELKFGEVKNLTEDQIEIYALEMGKKKIAAMTDDDIKELGRRLIKAVIAKVRAVDKDLNG